MKYFFRLIRIPLGYVVLAMEWLTRPKLPNHSAERQAQLDSETSQLQLYQFKRCPFCAKVRKGIRALGLNIEKRDALNDQMWRTELLEQGGKIKTPCLRIANEDGSVEWMYESDAIIAYLNQRFS